MSKRTHEIPDATVEPGQVRARIEDAKIAGETVTLHIVLTMHAEDYYAARKQARTGRMPSIEEHLVTKTEAWIREPDQTVNAQDAPDGTRRKRKSVESNGAEPGTKEAQTEAAMTVHA